MRRRRNRCSTVVQEVVDAPDTTLSLTLDAASWRAKATPTARRSSRPIAARRRPIRSVKPSTTRTARRCIPSTRTACCSNRGDRLETLRLPKETARRRRSAAARREPDDGARGRRAGNDSLRNVISQNASRLTDIVRLAPHVQEGQVIGFRVNPGRDRESFEALGLLPGDIVTDINGVVLDDASRGLQAFEALGEATMANVTVLREGTPTVLVIDTSQLQNLQEKRE